MPPGTRCFEIFDGPDLCALRGALPASHPREVDGIEAPLLSERASPAFGTPQRDCGNGPVRLAPSLTRCGSIRSSAISPFSMRAGEAEPTPLTSFMTTRLSLLCSVRRTRTLTEDDRHVESDKVCAACLAGQWTRSASRNHARRVGVLSRWPAMRHA